jgi:hypothetical protein
MTSPFPGIIGLDWEKVVGRGIEITEIARKEESPSTPPPPPQRIGILNLGKKFFIHKVSTDLGLLSSPLPRIRILRIRERVFTFVYIFFRS